MLGEGSLPALEKPPCRLLSTSGIYHSRITIHLSRISWQLSPRLRTDRRAVRRPPFCGARFQFANKRSATCKVAPQSFPSRVDLGKTVRLSWMQRIVHKSRNHRKALAWEQTQYQKMTPAERLRIARTLKRRAYPGPQPDVRGWHRKA